MKHLEAYADLLLQAGINLQPGQEISLGSEPVHWDFINLLAKRAYQLGAKNVACNIIHPGFGKARVDHSHEEHLDYVPDYAVTRLEHFAATGAASLYVGGSEHPQLMKDIDQKRNGVIQKSRRLAFKNYREATSSSRIPWCFCELPTPAWAEQVLGEPDVEALWDILVPILRLDTPDPIATWRELADTLGKRAAALDAMKVVKLHFEAPGTDLEVHIPEPCRWLGGSAQLPDGTVFMPNLPTEEIFTSPDFRKTSGRAQVTRPVEVLGSEVHGAWFEFADGEVVDYGAESGKERLDTFFELDEKARRLGEVALVDSGSPIFQSGRIFHSILYDENAACHIALGSSYADTYEGGPDLSEEERFAVGLNQSLLHTDFMIGCDGLRVTGTDTGGAEVPIMEDGTFAI